MASLLLRRPAAAVRTLAATRRLLSAAAGTLAKKINLNADLAEGFGPWSMTADSELMDIVTSANIACGGHAGDASIMAANLALASTRHVSVGSHPGYDDKPGFGRRVIPMTAAEIEELVAFQTGALLGVAGLARARQQVGEVPVQVTHVKPHGALNNIACVDKSVAAAIARAVFGAPSPGRYNPLHMKLAAGPV